MRMRNIARLSPSPSFLTSLWLRDSIAIWV